MLDKKIKDMLKELYELYDLAYQSLSPQVAYIIKNSIKDNKLLESTLDELLNIPTDKCYKLFTELCGYISKFNSDMANDYLKIYEEMYGEEKPKKKTI